VSTQMKFRNGRTVSEKVFQAVRYMTKVGVMTRQTWNENFGTGTLNWKQKQLHDLIRAKIFKPHPFTEVKNTYVMGSYGREMVQEMKWQNVFHVESKYIKHDETVARGAWKLEMDSICSKWLTERELRALKSKNFMLHGKENSDKYPDAVLILKGESASSTVALEYEKTAKNNWRYNKAIKAYSDSSRYNYVLFVVESNGIENSIKRSMKFIGDAHLNSRIGFITIEDWLKNPAKAEIRGLNKIKTISELVAAN
jgi:hypothetical protein